MENIILNKSNYEELMNDNKVILIDFYADWCVPCKTLSPIMESLANEYDGKVKIVKYDTEDDELDLTSKYSIRNIPTLIFIKDGAPVDRMTGVRSKDSIISKIESSLLQ